MGKLTNRRSVAQAAPVHGTARMAPRLMLLPALGLLLMTPAHSQSATNFNTQTLTPKSASAKKEKAQASTAIQAPASKAPASKDAGPASSSPSRYIGEADIAAYVESLSTILSMRGRATDPFGQYQDPDAKPIIKTTVAKTTRRAAAIQVTPFSEIIQRIKVTTIMPGEKCFLLANRSFKQGERMPLLFRGKSISAEIVSVGSRQIDFRNLETGETASLKMQLLPLGMTPGTKGITAPGMVADRPNTPIELEPYGATSDASPQNP